MKAISRTAFGLSFTNSVSIEYWLSQNTRRSFFTPGRTFVVVADDSVATYRVACQIVRTPAFPPAKVFEVVEVVDASRKRNLSADWIKLLRTKTDWQGVQGSDSCSHTHAHSLELLKKKSHQLWVDLKYVLVRILNCIAGITIVIGVKIRQVLNLMGGFAQIKD